MREVKLGEIFEVRLPANATTGYRWQWIPDRSAQRLGLIEAEYRVDPRIHDLDPATEDLVGVGGEMVFKFQARHLDANDLELRFEYRRTFEATFVPAVRTH